METARRVSIVTIVFILLSCTVSWAGTCNSTSCTGSNPWTAASASYEDVNYCVNTCATYGDTVNVPADTKTWSVAAKECPAGANQKAQLCITKNINFKGAGIDLTNITSTQPYIIAYKPDNTAKTGGFEISGFTIDANNIGAYVIAVYNLTTTEVSKIKIHHNKIKNANPSPGTGINITGTVYGVAYENQFDRVAIAWRAMGLDQNSWANFVPAYGTAKNFYFEDNTIGFSSPVSGYAGWSESGQGGRIVVRYNTWSNTTDELWDVHGLQSGTDFVLPKCEQYSTMVAEFYGNKIVDAAQKRWMFHRGSWLVMFNNSWAGAAGNPSIGYGQYSCDSCAKYGYGNGQRVNNTYIWSNIAHGSWVIMMNKHLDLCANLPPTDPNYYAITQNRNYFNYVENFNGTQGVGCGPLAARPSTCTTGVGYWATNKSCFDLTGQTGAYPMSPISGTLYKCTAPNTWTAFYTPYIYPYPLRTVAFNQTPVTAPPPPTTPPTVTTPPTTTTTTPTKTRTRINR